MVALIRSVMATTMLDLPDELLVDIFQRIPTTVSRLVNRRVRDLIPSKRLALELDIKTVTADHDCGYCSDIDIEFSESSCTRLVRVPQDLCDQMGVVPVSKLRKAFRKKVRVGSKRSEWRFVLL